MSEELMLLRILTLLSLWYHLLPFVHTKVKPFSVKEEVPEVVDIKTRRGEK